ncbi:MAG TPA: protoporphyrinogen oxidase [Pirellulaceae bacterium]|nr:protoporphyrinogen oxidase [Pirellulaceae bacterium]
MSTRELPSDLRVAVVGGGITGLAAAHRLTELVPDVQLSLFESSHRLGGALETTRRDGFLIEGGADNFITTIPWAMDLCRRIGFEDQLIQTNSGYRHAFVVRKGKPVPIPDGFVVMAPSKAWPMLTTPILSPLGKLRLACEYFVPQRRAGEEESLASFVRRRFGRETYDRLVQPLVGGIYTGDPDKLSLQSTMPRFAEMEAKHGSLIRALRNQPKSKERSGGARYSMFVAPRDGMSSLVDAIAGKLPVGCIHLDAPVERIAEVQCGWSLSFARDVDSPSEFDAVILATPAMPTAKLVASLDDDVARELKTIHHASCSIVSVGYARDQLTHPLEGFGMIVPEIERRKILSASFSSIKYAGRAPDDHVLIRVFIGGDRQAQLAESPDDQLLDMATGELRELLGIRGDPSLVQISRCKAAMPQYFVGHVDKLSRIRQRLSRHPGLHLAGNAYDGVGVPNCIHSGEQAAESLAKTFAPSSTVS